MDYKDLIRRGYSWNGNHFRREFKEPRSLIAEMCFAIETLLEERDAALNDLRGMCWCCINGQRWEKSKNLVTCDHLKQQGILAAGGSRKCDYWQWRGPKKED